MCGIVAGTESCQKRNAVNSVIRSEYFEQYFARYIFLKENYKHRHHQFFLAAGKLYKPQSTRQRTLPGPAIPVEDTELYDTRVEDDPQPGTSGSR